LEKDLGNARRKVAALTPEAAEAASLRTQVARLELIAETASREVAAVHRSKAWRAAAAMWAARDWLRRQAGRMPSLRRVRALAGEPPIEGRAAVIVISYNDPGRLRECLESLLANTDYPDYHVIVVDNASAEPVPQYLRELAQAKPRVEVVFNTANLGFAAANNLGLQLATDAEFVVLLNQDTVVPPGWLTGLLRHARRPEVGLVGPVTNWTGNEAKIDVTYTALREMPAFAEAYTRAHRGQTFEIKMLAMFCVAMRRSVAHELGPLDERFGQGMFEDEDYARRARQAGYQVICAEDVFVHHDGRASFGRLPPGEYHALFEHNRRLFEEKWGEPWVPHQLRGQRGRRPRLNRALLTFRPALKFYLANHLVTHIPTFRVRHWYYRRVLKYCLGRDSSIHMGAFVTGEFISIGDNVTINRRCYLDGRIGIEIHDNVHLSPEVYVISMEHDSDSPLFATRGGKVVIERHAWIGARADRARRSHWRRRGRWGWRGGDPRCESLPYRRGCACPRDS
jgi:GT2 family glycosyltransferase